MKYILSYLVCLAFVAQVQAQQLIQGTVKDATTGEAVPFVSVGIKGTAQGTVTNEQGNFAIKATTLPVTIVITHLSYQPAEVSVSDDKPVTISLKSQSVQLAEVSVGNPALTIIKLTAEKASKNLHTEYFPKVFFRRMTYEGDKPTFFAESFLDAQWQSWGLIKYNISNSRYLESDNAVNYNNIAMYSLLCSGYVNNTVIISPINHKPDSLYKYTLKQTFKWNGHEVAVIKCELKDSNMPHSAFVGDYYIDTDNYTVLKTDGTITRFELSASGPLSLKLKELRIVSQFKLTADSNTVLDYSNFTMKSALKAGIIGLKQLTYTGQVFALDYNQAVDKSALTEVSLTKMQKEEEKFKSVAYDAEYWKKNPVIKRTDAEDAAVAQLEQHKNVKGNISQ